MFAADVRKLLRVGWVGVEWKTNNSTIIACLPTIPFETYRKKLISNCQLFIHY